MSTEVQTPSSEHVADYPLDTYIRLEWHMQKLRLAVARLAQKKGAEQGSAVTRDIQQEALLELVKDPELREVIGLSQ